MGRTGGSAPRRSARAWPRRRCRFLPLAGHFGEAPGLTRIDLDHRKTLAAERALEGAVISARRRENGAGGRVGKKPADKGAKAPGVIGEPLGRPIGVKADVEMTFAMPAPAVCGTD